MRFARSRKSGLPVSTPRASATTGSAATASSRYSALDERHVVLSSPGARRTAPPPGRWWSDLLAHLSGQISLVEGDGLAIGQTDTTDAHDEGTRRQGKLLGHGLVPPRRLACRAGVPWVGVPVPACPRRSHIAAVSSWVILGRVSVGSLASVNLDQPPADKIPGRPGRTVVGRPPTPKGCSIRSFSVGN